VLLDFNQTSQIWMAAMQNWQLQEAKARMSELIERAQQTPQGITRHGKPVAVVMSRATFDALTRAQGSLVDFMRASPLYGADDLVFARDASVTRELAL
jgi:prevent-host-death family protein